jgi:hypothetical protein
MFKKLKMKIAARRVSAQKRRAERAAARHAKKSAKSHKTGFWARAWDVTKKIIAWPFKMLNKMFRAIWKWIRGIDLIGLLNMALLLAIIVLFSLLILNICNCRRNDNVIIVTADAVPVTVAQPAPKIAAPVTTASKPTAPRDSAATKRSVNLPIKRAARMAKKSKCCESANIPVQSVKMENIEYIAYGDITVDGELPGERLVCGAKINGNLYLQNMHKYTLPCGAFIDGDLYLRNVGMLKFCGEFTVTGNIYVSRNSSFGPIPSNARLGGQVIL